MATKKNAFTSIEIGVVANPTQIRSLSKSSLTSLLNISGEDIVLKNVEGLKKVSKYNLDTINTTSGIFRQIGRGTGLKSFSLFGDFCDAAQNLIEIIENGGDSKELVKNIKEGTQALLRSGNDIANITNNAKAKAFGFGLGAAVLGYVAAYIAAIDSDEMTDDERDELVKSVITLAGEFVKFICPALTIKADLITAAVIAVYMGSVQWAKSLEQYGSDGFLTVTEALYTGINTVTVGSYEFLHKISYGMDESFFNMIGVTNTNALYDNMNYAEKANSKLKQLVDNLHIEENMINLGVGIYTWIDKLISSFKNISKGVYIQGDSTNELIFGEEKNDTIYGGAGSDLIYADSGNDKVYGENGSDALYGEAGNDTIYGGNGNDSLFGGEGKDNLFGDAGNDTLIGGKGNDCLTGGAGADVFYYESGDGNDTILDYVSGQDLIYLGSGKVTGYSVSKGKDAVLTIDKGKITLKGVGNGEIDVKISASETVTFGGIAAGLKYNNNDLPKATAVTIDSAYSGKTFSAGYASIVTLNASGRTSAIELIGNAKNNRILGGGGADILNGGNGKDTIVGGAGDDILIGGKGNDCLTGSAGNDVFYYSTGDGADVIADFSTGDKIYIDGATSVSGSLKNNDVTFKIDSGSVKVTGGKGKEITIEYSNGTVGKYLNGKLTETYQVYSNGSQVDVIHKFVKSLDETNLSGISAVNEAVAACSNYTGLQNLIDNFISDCKKSASGDAFLKNYCGIDLDNEDTGAITGADAGGSTLKNAASVVPESTTKYVYPDSTSLAYKGLTLNVPSKSSLSSMQQNIVAGLNSWWLKESLDLVEKSYGLSFAESDATFKNATLSFYNNSLSSVNYKAPNFYGYSEWNSGDTTNRFKTYFGSNLFSSMDTATADGRLITSSSSNVLYLDRFFAVNFAIAAQAANTKYYNNLPNFIRFGISVLSVGGDDIYQSEIRELAGNSSKLASYVSTSNLTSNVEYDWAGGYMLFRYLAKQASSNPAPASGSNSAAPWFAEDNNFATGADLDSLIDTANSVGNISASNSSTNFAQDTAVLAENQIDIRAEIIYHS